MSNEVPHYQEGDQSAAIAELQPKSKGDKVGRFIFDELYLKSAENHEKKRKIFRFDEAFFQKFNQNIQKDLESGVLKQEDLNNSEILKTYVDQVVQEQLREIERQEEEIKAEMKKNYLDKVFQELSQEAAQNKELSSEEKKLWVEAQFTKIEQSFDIYAQNYLEKEEVKPGQTLLDYFVSLQKNPNLQGEKVNYEEEISRFSEGFIQSLKEQGLLSENTNVETLGMKIEEVLKSNVKDVNSLQIDKKIFNSPEYTEKLAQAAAENNGKINEEILTRIYFETAEIVLDDEDKIFLKKIIQEKEEEKQRQEAIKKKTDTAIIALEHSTKDQISRFQVPTEDITALIDSDPTLMHTPKFLKDMLVNNDKHQVFHNEQGTLMTLGEGLFTKVFVDSKGNTEVIIDQGQSKERRVNVAQQDVKDLERIIDTETSVLFCDEFLGLREFFPDNDSSLTKQKKRDFVALMGQPLENSVEDSGELKNGGEIYKDNQLFNMLESQRYFKKMFTEVFDSHFFEGNKESSFQSLGFLDRFGNLQDITNIIRTPVMEKKKTFDEQFNTI